jgi:hypothetical protein
MGDLQGRKVFKVFNQEFVVDEVRKSVPSAATSGVQNTGSSLLFAQ